VECVITVPQATPGAEVTDLGTGEPVSTVDADGCVRLVLGAHDARVIRVD
jgi:hypothetical protein